MLRMLLIIGAIFFLGGCCGDLRSESQMEADEAEYCASIDSVGYLYMTFRGFFPDEMDSVQIIVLRGHDTLKNERVEVPLHISDSSRHIRELRYDMPLKLSDTLIVTQPEIGSNYIYGFFYTVHAEYTKFCPGFGCMESMVMNGDTVQSIDFKDSDFPDGWTDDRRSYYKNH